MAIRSGFFNSVNGDRKYNARDISRLFDGMITDGVFLHWGNHFAMEPASSGLSVIVKSGRCWFNHAWVENDSNYTATFSMADPALSRTDAIVVEIDERDEYRRGTIKIVKGTVGGGNPTITKTEQVHQYVLAYVTIPAAATKLTASAITIKVGQGECPYAAGILDRVPIDEIWAQWNASFNEWFNSAKNTFNTEWSGLKTQFNTEWSGLKTQFNTEWQERKDEFDTWFAELNTILDENVATNLYNRIEEVNTSLNNRIDEVTQYVDDTAGNLVSSTSGRYVTEYVSQIFTESGTFTLDADIIKNGDTIKVTAVGPGGNGYDNGSSDIVGGGGAGGYVRVESIGISSLKKNLVDVPVTITDTVTSFGTLVSASKGGNAYPISSNYNSSTKEYTIIYSAGGNGGSGGGGGGTESLHAVPVLSEAYSRWTLNLGNGGAGTFGGGGSAGGGCISLKYSVGITITMNSGYGGGSGSGNSPGDNSGKNTQVTESDTTKLWNPGSSGGFGKVAPTDAPTKIPTETARGGYGTSGYAYGYDPSKNYLLWGGNGGGGGGGYGGRGGDGGRLSGINAEGYPYGYSAKGGNGYGAGGGGKGRYGGGGGGGGYGSTHFAETDASESSSGKGAKGIVIVQYYKRLLVLDD